MDRLHRWIELSWAEDNKFKGALNHQRNQRFVIGRLLLIEANIVDFSLTLHVCRFTYRCHDNSPISLQEMEDILKTMMTIDEETTQEVQVSCPCWHKIGLVSIAQQHVSVLRRFTVTSNWSAKQTRRQRTSRYTSRPHGGREPSQKTSFGWP